MGYDNIKPFFLHKLQQTFQRDICELIDIYLQDTTQKFKTLVKNLEDKNLPSFMAILQELRHRSVDVGAIQFSHYCLMLEITAQEMHFKKLPKLIIFLESVFVHVQYELEALRKNS